MYIHFLFCFVLLRFTWWYSIFIEIQGNNPLLVKEVNYICRPLSGLYSDGTKLTFEGGM